MKAFLLRATGFDRAVYWPPLDGTDDYGQYVSDAAIEIKCRWENIITDFVDREGKISVSTSTVFTLYPVAPGGILWHGKRTALIDPVNPLKNPGALEIRKIASASNYNNKVTLVTAKL